MNISLLRALQDRPDAYFWPESLARTLKIPTPRLLRELRELEEFGFGIDRQPHCGVRFGHPAARLCVDQIEWQLGTRTIGRRISVWRRTTSTNDLAAAAAKSRSNDGLVVLAEEQTAGRGRRHRRWFAPPHSSILMSVLVFPPESLRDAMLLTSLAAVAVSDLLIEVLDVPARIKWPNDIRIAGLKVCGILVEGIVRPRTRAAATAHATRNGESARSAASLRAVVIGIGINVNIPRAAFPSQLDNPATSLMDWCGRPLDRSELVRQLLQRLDHAYHSAQAGETWRIWKRWRECADLVGEHVEVERAQDRLTGRLVDIRPPGHCTLRLASGKVIELPVREVRSISNTSGVSDRSV